MISCLRTSCTATPNYIGTSGLVREIETDVREARTHEKWRAAYMTQQMRDMENRKLGREEGLIEGKKAGIIEGKKAGIESALLSLVKDNLLSIEEAAKRLNISVEEIRNMLA